MVLPGDPRPAPPWFPCDEVNVAAPPPLPQATRRPADGAADACGRRDARRGRPGLVVRFGVARADNPDVSRDDAGVRARHAGAKCGAARRGQNSTTTVAGYLDHLGALADQLTDTAARRHDSLVWVHPEPSALWTVADGPRPVRTRADDSDFGHVRVGVGAQQLAGGSRATAHAAGPPRSGERGGAAPLHRSAHHDRRAPVALALRGVPAVAVTGDPDTGRDLRAAVCQAAVLQRPGRCANRRGGRRCRPPAVGTG